MQQHHPDPFPPTEPGHAEEPSLPAPHSEEPSSPGPHAEEAPLPERHAEGPSLPEPPRPARELAMVRTALARWSRSRWFRIPAALVALCGLLGFLVVPPVLRSQLEKRLPPLLHRPVTVRQVLFNPFALSLTVRGFRIAERDGSTLLGFEELYVDVAVLRHLLGGLHVAEIRLVRPEVGVTIEKGGRLSIADLLEGGEQEPPPKAETAKKPIAIEIRHVVLDHGSISFNDYNRPQPFKARLEPLSIVLDGFTTEPQKNGAYEIKARLEPSTELDWKGEISMTPLRSSGVISVSGLRLAALGPYLSESTQLRITEGVLDLRLPYRFDVSQSPELMALADGSVKLSRLRVQPPGRDEALVALGALSLDGLSLDVSAQRVEVRSVALEEGIVLARRLRDGKIELAELAGPREPGPPKKSEPKESASAPWKVVVNEIRTSGLSLHWEDQVLQKPARLAAVDALSLRIGPYTFPGDGEARLEASMRLLGRGSFSLRGTTRPNIGSADLELELKDLPLAALQPYVAQAITGGVAAGDLQINGHLRVEPGKPPKRGGAPAASRTRFTGALALDQFSLVDKANEELAGFEKLALTEISVDSATLTTSLDKVLLKGARAHYRINADQSNNWSTLARRATPTSTGKEKPPGDSPVAEEGPRAEAARAPEGKPTGPQPKTSIRSIAIENLSLAVVDRSAKPQFVTRVTRFGGTIAPLTIPGVSKAKVDLSGKLDASRLTVTGTVLPAGKDSDVDLVVGLSPWALPPTSPYAIQYVGHAIEKGTLSLDIKYGLASRKVQGKTVLTINQLALGPSVESPTATKLPVKLALAILTDKNGKLELELPMEGDIDSPDYRFGDQFVKTLENVLEKVATSPFALLGSLFGSSEDLSFVEFQSGSSQLSGAERDKIAELAEALTERPALQLSIAGLYDPESDKQGLAKARLDELLVVHQRGVPPAGATPPAVPQPLSEADRAAALHALYQERVVKVREKEAEQLMAQGKPVPPGLLPKRDASAPEMEVALLSTVEVTPDDLSGLARRRGEGVQEELVTNRSLPPERVSVSAAKPESAPKRHAQLQLE
jgi:hypothetical protein